MSNDFAYRPGTSPTNGGGGGSGENYSGGGATVPRASGRESGLPPGTDPRKWSARFPVYQIDFTSVASGKRIATTKRRVRWRFGFSNRDALEAGETGTACRGEEHDVTIVWSVTSGKRLILADGQEVHYSTNRGGVMEYSWTMRGNHVLKVIAHAAPAMTPTPGFRQYDLYVDGQSFFNMPKVYELGLKGPIPSHARTPGVIDHAERFPSARAPPSSGGRHYDLSQGRYVGPEVPRNREEEEEDLQRAISASIEESRRHLSKTVTEKYKASSAASTPAPAPTASAPAPPPTSGSDLLDFGGENYSSAPPTLAAPPSSPAPAPALPAPAYDQFSAPPPPPQQQQPSTGGYDQYAGAAPGGGYDQYSTAGPGYGGESPSLPPQPASPPGYASGALVPAAPQPAGSYYSQQSGEPSDYYAQQQAQAPPVPPASASFDQFVAASASNPFAPRAPTDNDPFAPKAPPPPTFNDISSTILGAYGASDAGSATGSAPIVMSPSGASQPGSFVQAGASVESAVEGYPTTDAGGVDPYHAQLNINTKFEEEEKEEETDDVAKLMKNLVNIDDISSPVEKLSLNPFVDDREKEESAKAKAQKHKKSRGIPPPAAKWTGAQPSLSEMKHAKPTQAGEKKPVMANAFDPNAAYAGALVVRGSQNGGPPPLRQPTGFGIGANLSGGGYGGHMSQAGYGGYGQQQQPPQQQPGYGAPPMQQQMGYGAPPHSQYQHPPPPQQGYANYQY